ncbi:TcfC E-set like domain-containing protein [Aeromonas allosaccharophila]|uniref:TcfC E-set like domain-containing protein n=1 Tax=Aeromonas allosaccharophila TaxID=656 RepID=UPI002AE05498|nr:TcfC E-set like domain-containing protein [Aeromonas allosaccharophila]
MLPTVIFISIAFTHVISFFILSIALSSKAMADVNSANDDSSYAQIIREVAPADFQSLFAMKEQQVEVELVNGHVQNLSMALGYGRVQLSEESERVALRDFLLANDVSRAGVELVMAELDRGMESDASCKGDKLACAIDLTGNVAVVVDSVRSKVRLFLAPGLYTSGSGVPEYVDMYNPSPALVNNATLYGSYFNDVLNMTLNDRWVLGLPYGHIRGELSANSFDSRISPNVDKLVYDLEFERYRISAGRSRDFNNINATALLNLQSVDKEGIYFMTSRNLSIKDSRAYQRLYFYMPQSGVVEVYREQQLLFTQTVTAGQQYISYDQLPGGVYPLTLKLMAGDAVLAEQTSTIVNSQAFTLNTGDMDFNIGVANAKQDNQAQDMLVAEAELMYRPMDALMVGGGMSVGEGVLSRIGGKWLVTPELNADAVVGVFSDGARYYSGLLSYRNLSLNYLRYDAELRDKSWEGSTSQYSPTFSEMLMGTNNAYEQLSLSTSLQVGTGSGYFSAFYYQSDTTPDSDSTNLSFNIGYNVPFINRSMLGINMGINDQRNRTPSGNSITDNVSVGLNWSMPLGDNATALMNANWDKAGRDGSVMGSVRRNFEINRQSSASLEVGAGYRNQHRESSAMGSLNYRGRHASFSGSSTVMEQGGNNIFASVSGTQMVSADGIYFSSQPADSYLVVRDETPAEVFLSDSRTTSEVKGTQQDVAPRHGQLQLGSRGSYQGGEDYDAVGGAHVVALGKYQPYQAKLNVEGNGLHNRGDSEVRGFTFPGTVMTMTTRFDRELQLLGAFYLANGEPVGSLLCEGDGCLAVDKLDDGLFKIRLSAQGNYLLRAGSQRCLENGDVALTERLTQLPAVHCTPHSDPRLLPLSPIEPASEPMLSVLPAKGGDMAMNEVSGSCQVVLAEGETLYSAVQPFAQKHGLPMASAVQLFIERNQQADRHFDVTRIQPGQRLLCPELLLVRN